MLWGSYGEVGNNAMILKSENSCLLIIDIQEKLLAEVSEADAVIHNADLLMHSAARLGVPVLVSEQYPKGLGPTVQPLAGRIPREGMEGTLEGGIVTKTSFSCVGEPEYMELLNDLGRDQLVIAGIEAHVCVLQTALDLRDKGHKCFVVADAVSSRTPQNRVLALERMNANGCEIVTTEMVLFEWLRDAGHSAFKELSKLVR